jgi:hypothetical protein
LASVANTVTGPVPNGGSVTFYLDYGTASQKKLGAAVVVGGAASFTTKSVPAGIHAVTAVYGGTANYQPATSNAVDPSVVPANTTTAWAGTAPGTIAYGTRVTFTVAVNDPDTGLVPAGPVQFWDGTVLLATVNLNGQGKASLTRSLARGTHAITAVYLGNANFNGSASGAVSLAVV